MRGMLLGLALVMEAGAVRGDPVFVFNQTGGDTTSLASKNVKLGQSFVNTAGEGWRLNEVTLRVFHSGGSGDITGSVRVDIYSAGLSPASNYLPSGGSLVYSTFNYTGQASLDFTSFTETTTGSGALSLNQAYVAVFDFSGQTWANGVLLQYELNGSPTGYSGSNSSINAGSAWQVTSPYSQIRSSVSMVPEPGTLLLGGIAAACGGGGVWWRRKRKAQVAEAVETVTAV